MPPRKATTKRPTGNRTTSGGKSHTGGYTRKDGTKVKGYDADRGAGRAELKTAWGGAAVSGGICIASLLTAGFTIITALAMILTAGCTLGALALNAKAGKHQNRARRRIAANRRTAARTRASARRRTTTRRR